MLDSNIIKALFTLLRSGLWNTPVDNAACFPLQDVEWDSLYKIAITQTIEGVIYDGIQKLPHEFLPPRAILLKWIVKISKIESSNAVMNRCIQEQVAFFNKIGAKPILLKGQGIAHYYPHPDHRVCGDIDWFFKNPADVKVIERQLKAKNIKIYTDTIDSKSYLWRSCLVENHTKLFDVFNPIAHFKLKLIIEKQLTTNDGYIGKDKVYETLPPNLNIIQVNLHILKHLLSFGIGLRQFCDAAILYAALVNQYDKKWLYSTYQKLGILNWVYVLHDLLVNYIGLDKEKLPFPNKDLLSSSWLVEDVLATGNFGFYDNKFTEIKDDNSIERRNKSKKLWYSFQRYFHLAPYEAISFPMVHFMERFKSMTIG